MEYNKQPVLERFHSYVKEHGLHVQFDEARRCLVVEDQVFTLPDTDAIKKNDWEGYLAYRYLKEVGVEIPDEWRKIKFVDPILPPLEVLNQLGQQLGSTPELTVSRHKQGFVCTGHWTIEGKPYSATYGPFKDASYVKHKVASHLIKKARSCEPVWEAYKKLSKQNKFVHGLPFPTEGGESERVEFKGDKDGVELDQKKARDLVRQHLVCALLNTNGGQIFFGVGSKEPYNIQGIWLNYDEKDTFLVSVHQMLRGIDPPPATLVRVEAHCVLAQENRADKQPYVLELEVARSDDLHWVTPKGVAYVRRGPSTVSMEPEEIRRRVLARNATSIEPRNYSIVSAAHTLAACLVSALIAATLTVRWMKEG